VSEQAETGGARWLLPEGIEEVVPPRAQRMELLQRALLDRFHLWGYDLVIPPPVEYLESLLVGVGGDLELQTFKVTDQLTGRLMGLRADITSQAARIDAHSLGHDEPTRLCYAGTVLHAKPAGLLASRCPIRIGAELYGVPGAEGDAEILALMAETLDLAGVRAMHLELGHVGIYRLLAQAAGLDAAREGRLFEALQRKAPADIEQLLADADVADGLAEMMVALPGLHGDAAVLARARRALAGAPGEVMEAVDRLERTAQRLAVRCPGVRLGFDLAELRGYRYHTGMVFSAYADDLGHAVARGGRYDDIGRAFGRARPATGFDCDLGVLADLGTPPEETAPVVLAPSDDGLEPARTRALWRRIAELREQGWRVICAPAAAAAEAKQLRWDGSQWQVSD